MCVGGPLHGQYRPASMRPVVTPAATVPYVVGINHEGMPVTINMAPVPKPILYYPNRIALPGWRFPLHVFVKAEILAGVETLEMGTVMPGGIQGMPYIHEAVCRWCYGRPMTGLPVCSRVACITNWTAVESLDGLSAEDAKGWSDDA
jgi:hypothetical protein